MFGNKAERQQAQFMAPQWLKIAEESVHLVNTTVSPQVFFKRYDLCIETFKKLVSIEKYMKFSGSKPHVFLNELIKKRDAATHDFIMRCYEKAWKDIDNMKTLKGKINKINKVHDSIEMYYDYISKENLKYMYDLRDSTIEVLKEE